MPLDFLPWAVAGVTGLATSLGGLVALRSRASLGLLLAFSGGAVVGVALFDLLNEALALGRQAGSLIMLGCAAAGFAGYLALNRLGMRLTRGVSAGLAPAGLVVHSVMDGLAIGLGFQVSIGVGLIAALAVLAHDLMDGINTVVLSLAGFRSRLVAAAWLLLDAAAPAAGIWLSHQVRVSAVELAVGLALFAGGFLYIGTVELLPRAHAGGARSSAVVASAAGLGLIWLVVRLAG